MEANTVPCGRKEELVESRHGLINCWEDDEPQVGKRLKKTQTGRDKQGTTGKKGRKHKSSGRILPDPIVPIKWLLAECYLPTVKSLENSPPSLSGLIEIEM